MRKVASAFVILLVTLTLAGCRNDRRPPLYPYGWEASQPELDSLTVLAESLYIHHRYDSLPRVITRMHEIADAHPTDSRMALRVDYWTARHKLSEGDTDAGVAMMRDLMSRTDSAKFPYEYHRLMWNLDMGYHTPSLERYRYLLNELEFFINAGDVMMSAGYCMDLGTFLNNVGDTEHGIPYLYKADSLLRLVGATEQIANNRINHADALANCGDSAAAAATLRTLLEDTVNPIGSYARDIVMGNLYNLTGDTTLLRRAYEILLATPAYEPEARCMYENLLASEALNRGDMSTAIYYHNLAARAIDSIANPALAVEYYRLHYTIFERKGQMDSAFAYLYKAAAISEEINNSNHQIKIRNANLAAGITRERLQADLERRRLTMIQMGVTFGLLLTVIIGAIIFYRRLQHQKLARMRASLELEWSNRRIMAMELMMEEKENLFDTVSHEMEELSQQGEISRVAAGRIAGTLKAHSGTKPDREGFMETFDKLDPAFTRNIRHSHPGLTDADLRLAAFIALGMDNKHIARVMAIRPESVKQARWRLRTKMGLASGESLENAVRKFTGQPEQ